LVCSATIRWNFKSVARYRGTRPRRGIEAGDVCARANFAHSTRKALSDRRAGRIPTEVCEKLVDLLTRRSKRIGDTQVIIKAGKEHRFVVIFRGKGLEGPLTDADPNARLRHSDREAAPMRKISSRKKWRS